MLHDSPVMFRELASLSGFSLERLASLCEVGEAGSIGQAARGDANRQSLLSRQIAELEAVFGVALLARQSKPFRLTEEGRELARAARAFFQAAEDVRSRAGGEARRVVIGAGETLIQWLLFPACEAVRKGLGEPVVFAFKNLESARLVEALHQGVVDAALIRPEDAGPGLVCARAWRYEQAAFVPKALSGGTAVLRAVDLGAFPWAVLEGRGHFRRFLEERACAAGVRLNAALECSSYTQVALAVRSGRYAGFLPEFAKPYLGGGVPVIRRMLEPALAYQRGVALAWREAGVKARPFLAGVFEGLERGLGRRL